MAIKFNKENKVIESRTTASGKWCTITLVIQIVLTFVIGIIAFTPFLTALSGFMLAAALVLLSIFLTFVTVGIIWTNAGARSFFGKGFEIARQALENPDVIKSFLKPHIVYITVPMFVVSLVGFVFNLIYYLKHDKANKARFITSIIILVIATANLILALAIYLNAK